MELTFNIPAGMKAEQVAEKLVDIMRRLRNEQAELHNGSYGPWLKQILASVWQLDATNDFFFHYYGATGMMRCRESVPRNVFTTSVVGIFLEEFGREGRESVESRAVSKMEQGARPSCVGVKSFKG